MIALNDRTAADRQQEVGPFPAPEHSAETAVAAEPGLESRIDDVVTGLEPTLQDLIVQHYFQGLSADQIAEQQRMRIGEIFSLLDLALFTILHRLEQAGVVCERDDLVDCLRCSGASVPRRLERRILRDFGDQRGHWARAWQRLQGFFLLGGSAP